MASPLLILTQSDKRTKFDKEVELAEDGKHHSAIRRAIKEAALHDRLHKTEMFEQIQRDIGLVWSVVLEYPDFYCIWNVEYRIKTQK